MPKDAWAQPHVFTENDVSSSLTEEDLKRWVFGPGKHIPFTRASSDTTTGNSAPTESEMETWIPIQEDLQKQPQDVLNHYGIYTGGSGVTALEHGVVGNTREQYQGESGIQFPSGVFPLSVSTLDTQQRPVWAVAVTKDFYSQYGILPIQSHQVLSTPYSGHDWGIIHKALCTNSRIQLRDGLSVYAYANAIDVKHSAIEIDIHPNVLYMIEHIEHALHPSNPRHITTYRLQGTFTTIADYVAWYNTPLPPLPDIDTGQ